MEEKVKQLLGEISSKLGDRNDKKKNFNIFSILGIESKELIHSKFLANLLNPEGKHNHGDFFLRSFVQRFLPENPLENTNVTVRTEQPLFNKNEKKSLGRADIWLVNNNTNKYVIIENKLFAIDQWRQLKRYTNYLTGVSVSRGQREGALLYLTLNGKPATKPSVGSSKDVIYKSISYLKICKWLQDCLKTSLSITIAEGIKQYIETIESLILKYEIIEDIKKVFPFDYIEVINQIVNNKVIVPEVDKKIKQAIKFMQDESLLNYLYSELELIFWENLEKEIESCEKYEIIDRKKYSYEKIEKSRKNGGRKISYGLICEIPNKGLLRIYSNKSNFVLKYGFGYFDLIKTDEWKWNDNEPKILTNISLSDIIVNKHKVEEVIDEIVIELNKL